VGLFRKSTPTYTCPICRVALDGNPPARDDHWESHTRQIPPGEGAASGQYTWECVCGPSGVKAPKPGAVATIMALHMEDRHGIPRGGKPNRMFVDMALRDMRSRGYLL
jgi:hypothetical protein